MNNTLPKQSCPPTALQSQSWRQKCVYCLLALAWLTVTSCDTTSQHHQQSAFGDMGGLLNYRSEETVSYFQDVYRTSSVYRHFRPVLVVDALLMDRTYRKRFVESLGRQYLLERNQVLNLQKIEDQSFDKWFELMVFVYEGEKPPTRLDKQQSLWRVYLRDDEGSLLSPLSITALKKTESQYLWLQTHFEGLDRWSEVYRLRFAKLPKGILQKRIGSSPFELIITGVRGKATLQWEDKGLFYRLAPASKNSDEMASRTGFLHGSSSVVSTKANAPTKRN